MIPYMSFCFRCCQQCCLHGLDYWAEAPASQTHAAADPCSQSQNCIYLSRKRGCSKVCTMIISLTYTLT